jgi:predicted MFS family arabinose efflux permease
MNESMSRRLVERLVQTDDDRCSGLSRDACDAAPGNFVRTVVANFFTKLGDAIASPKITLAWLIGAVGAPAALIGLLVPIRESGSLLPQLAIAGYIRRLPVRKNVWVAGALVQALAVAGIGVVALLLDGALAGWSIIALLVVFSLARGFSSIASKDVLGRTIPKAQRGQTNGWAASAAGLATLALGGFLIIGMVQGGDVVSYAWLVILAAGLWVVAAVVYSRIVEYPGETSELTHPIRDALARLSLLRDDRVLRRFVITRSLLLCSALSAPFYINIAQDALGSRATLLGVFIIASGLASMVSGPIWGRLADRSSRSVMMLGASLAAALGVSVFSIARSDPSWFEQLWLMPLLYFLLAVAHQGVRVGRKTYVVDIADGNERTDYVAVSNTAIGFVLLFTGMLSAVAAAYSVPVVVLSLSLLGLIGVVMGYRLPDP